MIVGRPTYQEEECRKLARCKRDIIFALSEELQNIVRHKEFAQLKRIRFDDDFFKLIFEHQAAATQLSRTDQTN